MTCSPSNLFVDVTLWTNDNLFSSLVTSYQNYTLGGGDDGYDCALRSVPCLSDIVREMTFSEVYNGLVFWFDMLVAYSLDTLIILMGLFGNIASILVFSSNKIGNDSTNFLLLAISTTDLLSCIVQFCLLITCYLCFFDVSVAISSFNIIMPPVFHASRWLNLLSLDFVVFLAIQRAGAVFIPFRASIVFSYRNTKIVVLFLGIFFTVTTVSFYTHLTPDWVFHPYFNKSISLHYNHRPGIDTQTEFEHQLRYSSARFVTNLCLTIFFVSVTVFKLISQSKSRASLQAGTDTAAATAGQSSKAQMSTGELKVMKMSLTVCFVTFVVYTTQTLAATATIPLVSIMSQAPIVPIFFYVGKILVGVSSAFNFFLYMKMSTLYRQAFKNMFSKRV